MEKKKLAAILAIIGALLIGATTFTKAVVAQSKGGFGVGVGFLGGKMCIAGNCTSIPMSKMGKKSGGITAVGYLGLIAGILALLAGLGFGVLSMTDKDGSKAGLIDKAKLATVGSSGLFLVLLLAFGFMVKSKMKGIGFGWAFFVGIVGAALAIASFFIKEKAE